LGDNPSLAQHDHLPGAIVFGDDAQVCKLLVDKRWSERSFVAVTIRRLT
jgi:Holliday junction resolvase RusA-like endonuclease